MPTPDCAVINRTYIEVAKIMLLKFQNLLNLLDSCDIIKTVGVTI